MKALFALEATRSLRDDMIKKITFRQLQSYFIKLIHTKGSYEKGVILDF